MGWGRRIRLSSPCDSNSFNKYYSSAIQPADDDKKQRYHHIILNVYNICHPWLPYWCSTFTTCYALCDEPSTEPFFVFFFIFHGEALVAFPTHWTTLCSISVLSSDGMPLQCLADYDNLPTNTGLMTLSVMSRSRASSEKYACWHVCSGAWILRSCES